jgi:putative intracellular protease/amidase
MTIGVALFDGAEELDWAGPWEVLAAWAQQWPTTACASSRSRARTAVTCAKGLRVLPDETWETRRRSTCSSTRRARHARGAARRGRARLGARHLEERRVVASVCTGSLVLAAAGCSTASRDDALAVARAAADAGHATSRCGPTTASSTTAT